MLIDFSEKELRTLKDMIDSVNAEELDLERRCTVTMLRQKLRKWDEAMHAPQFLFITSDDECRGLNK